MVPRAKNAVKIAKKRIKDNSAEKYFTALLAVRKSTFPHCSLKVDFRAKNSTSRTKNSAGRCTFDALVMKSTLWKIIFKTRFSEKNKSTNFFITTLKIGKFVVFFNASNWNVVVFLLFSGSSTFWQFSKKTTSTSP